MPQNKGQLSFIPNEDPSKEMSYSKIITFLQCPLRFKNTYLSGVAQYNRPTPEMNFGNSVHNTLKDFYSLRRKEERTLFNLLSILDKNWIRDNEANSAKGKELYNFARNVMTEFYYANDPLTFPLLLEHHFSLWIGNFAITGRVDRIDKLPMGNSEIIDYKTFEPILNQEEADASIQLTIYYLV